jgi:hypothetical protein
MEYQLSVAKSVNTIKPHFQGHQESNSASDLVMTVKKRGRVDSPALGYWTISNQNTTIRYHASTITTMSRSQKMTQTVLTLVVLRLLLCTIGSLKHDVVLTHTPNIEYVMKAESIKSRVDTLIISHNLRQISRHKRILKRRGRVDSLITSNMLESIYLHTTTPYCLQCF